MPDFDYPNHYLADDFPMFDGKKLDELAENIKELGILSPITLYDDGTGLKKLDGRNRHAAARKAGHKFKVTDFKIFTGTLEEAEAYVNSVNTKRRDNSPAVIHKYIENVIKRYPKATLREIERITGHSHNTVGKVKDKLLNPDKISPAMLKEFETFKKAFEAKWPDHLRLQFVRYFENDINALLRS
jgi:hypothetical protein